jgi:hypothetical protein
MTYILAEQRDADVVAAFANYASYLRDDEKQFPPSAYTLATSDWYFDFNDRRCPHDSRLESAVISEPSAGSRDELRFCTITVRLLGAYHDGHIEFVYPNARCYRLSMEHLGQGHGDWRYDEFRLGGDGRVIHEIAWATFGTTGRWIIEASDVHHKWTPKSPMI